MLNKGVKKQQEQQHKSLLSTWWVYGVVFSSTDKVYKRYVFKLVFKYSYYKMGQTGKKAIY